MKHNSKAIKSHSKLYDINKRGILIWDNFVSHSIFNLIRYGDGIKACVVLNVAVGKGKGKGSIFIQHSHPYFESISKSGVNQ